MPCCQGSYVGLWSLLNYDNSSQPPGAAAGAQGGAGAHHGQRAVKLTGEQILISNTHSEPRVQIRLVWRCG